jgi:hypothetical protein
MAGPRAVHGIARPWPNRGQKKKKCFFFVTGPCSGARFFQQIKEFLLRRFPVWRCASSQTPIKCAQYVLACARIMYQYLSCTDFAEQHMFCGKVAFVIRLPRTLQPCRHAKKLRLGHRHQTMCLLDDVFTTRPGSVLNSLASLTRLRFSSSSTFHTVLPWHGYSKIESARRRLHLSPWAHTDCF